MELNMNGAELTSKLIDNAKDKYPGYNITNTAIYFRDFDKTFEVIGYVSDPPIDPIELYGREILFPKKWVTLTTHTLEEVNGY
jgi:hypothetical protein